MSHSETASKRDLTWDGCANVRDLGGHGTEDGGETRFGAVVRADSVRQLSDEGWMALVDYGIRTIVDLRTERELEADPPAELPVDVLHVPFLEEDAGVSEEVEATSAAAPDHTSAQREVYLIFLERFRKNVAAAVGAVANAREGGVVVHCMGGKDRTGLTTALLLRLAGVGHEEIGADYALSEERLRPRNEAWFAEAADETELERMRRIAATPAETMTGVLDQIEGRYGSVEEFLLAGGAGEGIGDRIRSRLRG
jgi:protein-tyrosine phosphatase